MVKSTLMFTFLPLFCYLTILSCDDIVCQVCFAKWFKSTPHRPGWNHTHIGINYHNDDEDKNDEYDEKRMSWVHSHFCKVGMCESIDEDNNGEYDEKRMSWVHSHFCKVGMCESIDEDNNGEYDEKRMS